MLFLYGVNELHHMRNRRLWNCRAFYPIQQRRKSKKIIIVNPCNQLSVCLYHMMLVVCFLNFQWNTRAHARLTRKSIFFVITILITITILIYIYILLCCCANKYSLIFYLNRKCNIPNTPVCQCSYSNSVSIWFQRQVIIKSHLVLHTVTVSHIW